MSLLWEDNDCNGPNGWCGVMYPYLDANSQALALGEVVNQNNASSSAEIFFTPVADTDSWYNVSGGQFGFGTNAPDNLVDIIQAAPAVDIVQISNSSATTTTGVDGLNVSFSQGSGTITNAGIRVNATTGNDTGTLYGLLIDSLSGGTGGTNYGLNVGDGWDRGLNYEGSARPAIKMVLSPEYLGAVPTASGSATTVGTMTSDASPSANFRTYYEWASSQSSLQDYSVAVRVTLPSNFSAWQTSNALQISFNTNLTTTDTNKLDITIYHPSDDADDIVVQKIDQVSSSTKTWENITVDDSELDDGTSPDWDAAGETVIIYLRLYAKATGNYVQIGDITLNYLAAF